MNRVPISLTNDARRLLVTYLEPFWKYNLREVFHICNTKTPSWCNPVDGEWTRFILNHIIQLTRKLLWHSTFSSSRKVDRLVIMYGFFGWVIHVVTMIKLHVNLSNTILCFMTSSLHIITIIGCPSLDALSILLFYIHRMTREIKNPFLEWYFNILMDERALSWHHVSHLLATSLLTLTAKLTRNITINWRKEY